MKLFKLEANLGDSNEDGSPDVDLDLQVFGFDVPLPNQGRADLEMVLRLIEQIKTFLKR